VAALAASGNFIGISTANVETPRIVSDAERAVLEMSMRD